MNTATVNTKELSRILSVCERTTKRTPCPALRNVAISLNGSALITWTDREQNLSVFIPCQHEGEDFAVLLNGVSLASAIRGDRSGIVELCGNGTISCDGVRQTIGHIDEDGSAIYRPAALVIRDNGKCHSETVLVADLRDAIDKTLYAVDPDSSRYALGAIRIETNTDGMQFVATDSRRLVVASIRRAKENGEAGNFETMLPAMFAENLLKLLPEAGEVRITENGEDIHFQWDGGTYLCRSMQGRFPRYRDVFPYSHDLEITFNVSAALKALKELKPHVSPENRGIDCRPSFTRGEMIVSAGPPGEQVSKAFKIQGLDRETSHCSAYDLRFLVGYLESLSKKSSVTLRLRDDGSPARLLCENTDSVVMPLARD